MSSMDVITDERFASQQNRNILTDPPKGKSKQDNIMPPRRHVEENGVDEFALREGMHVLMLANTSMCKALEAQVTKGENGNGNTNKRVTLLMAFFAAITLMGTGANFLTNSGMMIGGKQQEIQQTQRDLQRVQLDLDKIEQRYEKSELRLREYEVWLQTTREKLADKGWKLPALPKGQE